MATIELLEPRIAPATLVGKVLTYIDVDGEIVTLKFTTRGTLTPANFIFDNAFETAGPQQLRMINLSGDRLFDGTSIVMKLENTGLWSSMSADIGFINANGNDLGTVKIAGDIGRIEAGDSDPAKAIASLMIKSLGVRGATTQVPGDYSEQTFLNGAVGSIRITGDIDGAELIVTGGSAGHISSLLVEGNLVGRNFSEGSIVTNGNIGKLAIHGNILGGNGDASGRVIVTGKVGSVTLGKAGANGDIIGGNGIESGSLSLSGNVGKFSMAGGLFGGSGDSSAIVVTFGSVGSMKIGKGVYGASGSLSGLIQIGNTTNALSITRGIFGGTGDGSGVVQVIGNAKTVTIGNSVFGDGIYGNAAPGSGTFAAIGGIGTMTLKGNLQSGSGGNSGAIESESLIRSLTITGNVLGTEISPAVISATRTATAGAKTNPTIGKLTIQGNADYLQVLGGYRGFIPRDADAQIGSVVVKGDFLNSSIVAGVEDSDGNGFGNALDRSMDGLFTSQPTVIAKIGKVTIGGIAGKLPGGAFSYGITAAEVGSITIVGIKLALTKGAINDSGLIFFSGPIGTQHIIMINEL